MVSEPMVQSVQTLHLCYTETNTITNYTKARLHMTHVI
jgi:hypothetical protein